MVITVIENHDFELGMNEETGIGVRGLESKFTHANTQVIEEKLGTIDLPIDALFHKQDNVTVFKPRGAIILGQFHIERLVGGLVALKKGIAKINLPRSLAMCGSQKKCSANSRPSHKGL